LAIERTRALLWNKYVGETLEFKYSAFLSYSHSDASWAKWLHAALEGVRIDRDLVGRETPVGPVPRSLYPIFRDRDDFPAGHSLTDQTLAALSSSKFLLVLCSPSSAKSHYVNEEIRRFKAMGGAQRVIAVIVEGDPGDPDRECLPKALRARVGPDGSLTSELEDPVAADARSNGDGKDMALQKVIAGLLGLGLDVVVRRQARRKRRQVLIRNSIIAILATLAITSGAGFIWARYELSRNEMLLDRTLQRATDLVDKAVTFSEQFGVPRALTLSLLDQAEGLFKDMSELGSETPALRFRKANMLIAFARNYAALGNTKLRLTHAEAANRLMIALGAEQPTDLAWQSVLATSYDVLGGAMRKSNNADALKGFLASIAIRERLTEADPGNMQWQEDLASTLVETGKTLRVLRSADTLSTFQRSLKIVERLADREPGNSKLQSWRSGLYLFIGDTFRDQGNASEALNNFRIAIGISERTTAAYPDSRSFQGQLGWSYLKAGDIRRNEKEFNDALKYYQQSLSVFKRLSAADPGDAVAQGYLGWGYSRVGDAIRHQSIQEGLDNYQQALAIFERLAAADPSNFVRRRALDVQYYKVGDMRKAQGSLKEALEAYQTSLAIADLVATTDPRNGIWQCELASRYDRVGNVLKMQGKFADARENYRAAVTIGEKLTATDSKNVAWQRQLSYSLERLDDLARESGNREASSQSPSIAGYLVASEPVGASRGDAVPSTDARTEGNVGTGPPGPREPPDDIRAFPCGTPPPED